MLLLLDARLAFLASVHAAPSLVSLPLARSLITILLHPRMCYLIHTRSAKVQARISSVGGRLWNAAHNLAHPFSDSLVFATRLNPPCPIVIDSNLLSHRWSHRRPSRRLSGAPVGSDHPSNGEPLRDGP